MKSILRKMGLVAFVIIEVLIHIIFGTVVSYAGYVRIGGAIVGAAIVLPIAIWAAYDIDMERKLS